MSVSTNPLKRDRVMPGPEFDQLRADFGRELLPIRTIGEGERGGFTLRAREHQHANDSDHPAALLYWGPLPSTAQGRLREMVKPAFDLSIMRSPRAVNPRIGDSR
ncbi:MAG TPA: hypothetical protein VF796_30410 [Humisphaera sp.]